MDSSLSSTSTPPADPSESSDPSSSSPSTSNSTSSPSTVHPPSSTSTTSSPPPSAEPPSAFRSFWAPHVTTNYHLSDSEFSGVLTKKDEEILNKRKNLNNKDDHHNDNDSDHDHHHDENAHNTTNTSDVVVIPIVMSSPSPSSPLKGTVSSPSSSSSIAIATVVATESTPLLGHSSSSSSSSTSSSSSSSSSSTTSSSSSYFSSPSTHPPSPLTSPSWLSRHILFVIISLVVLAFLIFWLISLFTPLPLIIIPTELPSYAVCNLFSLPEQRKTQKVNFVNGNGVVAEIYAVPRDVFESSNPLSITSLNDFTSHVKPLNMTNIVFLSSISIPTRPFLSHVVGRIRNDDPPHIVFDIPPQYFIVTMRSKLLISESLGDHKSYKQFGIISDDGAVVFSIDSEGKRNILINNDGTHQSRLSVSSTFIDFTTVGSVLEMEIQWFQGPKDNIAVYLMWRDVPTEFTHLIKSHQSSPQLESFLENSNSFTTTEGDDIFFSPSGNGVTNGNFNALQSLGWQVIRDDNYHFLEGFHSDYTQHYKHLQKNGGDPCGEIVYSDEIDEEK